VFWDKHNVMEEKMNERRGLQYSRERCMEKEKGHVLINYIGPKAK
jgi:hypothetical protein